MLQLTNILISKDLHIQELQSEDAVPWELLLEADPSTSQIEKYLEHGICFIGKITTELAAVLVLDSKDDQYIEIKNIAVSASFQKQGIGKKLLQFAADYAKKNNYKKLLVGTANSSIYQLAFYQKAGFEVVGIEKNFFLNNYRASIFENGIQAKHKMLLQKNIS